MRHTLLTGMITTLAVGSLISPLQATSFNGGYMGVHVGTAHTSSSYQGHHNDQTFRMKFGEFGFVGGLFGGLGTTFNNIFYIGVEGHLNYNTTKEMIENVNNTPSNLKQTYALGGGVRLGCLLRPRSMLFFHIGVDAQRWQLTKHTTHKTQNLLLFIEPGLGLELDLGSDIHFHMKYSYAMSTKRLEIAATKNKITPNQGKVLFGVSYQF